MSDNTEKTSLIEDLFNKIPVPVFLVDENITIIALNEKAAELADEDKQQIYAKRGGDALACIHSVKHPSGCGFSESCKSCIIRNSVLKAYQGNETFSKLHKLELSRGGKRPENANILVSAAPFEYEGRRLVILTLEDITEVMDLRKLIPICANCKKIRDDKDYWLSIEHYFEKYKDLSFTHGVCPECMDKLYPEVGDALPQEKE